MKCPKHIIITNNSHLLGNENIITLLCKEKLTKPRGLQLPQDSYQRFHLNSIQSHNSDLLGSRDF